MSKSPVRGKTYVFTDLSKLALEDSPYLTVIINGYTHPIQTSHVSDETLLKNCPVFAKSLWRYNYTTKECIPVFKFAGTEQELFRLVDYEACRDPYSALREEGLWVTPKGSPRPQYY